MRPLLSLAVLLLLPAVARAEGSVWFDSGMGCGRGAAFAKSGKAADLPGCTGRLPKNPPQMEVVLHDAKRDLVDAEEALGKEKLEKVDKLIESAQGKLAHVPPMHP